MERNNNLLAARGLTDDRDRLITADEPLADLHSRCGGTMPGTVAVPELLDLIRQGRTMGLRIAREFTAFDGEESVTGFARIHPRSGEDGGGCEVLVENWQRSPADPLSESEAARRFDAIDQSTAEVTARLDRKQAIQLIDTKASDVAEFQQAVAEEPGRSWTEYVELQGVAHQQPLHWRLLDGAKCRLPGSDREWRARLLPIGSSTEAPQGFELLLIANRPLLDEPANENAEDDAPTHLSLIGSALTPALRKPIARLVANAETIKSKLAGPLRQEYADYAGNIASAGQHLNAMLEDLADMEIVEAEAFETARERVPLSDAAHRAAGILGVRARSRDITLELPEKDVGPVAEAEFRRVLQVLLNLIGNAVAYSPDGSTVSVTLGDAGNKLVSITVADQGPGIDVAEHERVFDKFERLGRDNDGGSGLGLYISRRLANVMEGDITLESAPGEGARFTLTLPAAG